MEPGEGGESKAKRLNLEDYELGTTLGTGSFGRVRIAKDKKDEKYVAVKIMKKAEIIKMKTTRRMRMTSSLAATMN